MSLAAAVYIKKSHISIEWLDDTITVDEKTGEVVSETFHIPAKAKEAISYRLGNGKYIRHCREELEKTAKGRGLAMPVLFDQVLSEDVQRGDVVTFADVPKLKRELKFLERTKFSTDVKEFLFRMNKLVEAAEMHRNPIAFT